MNPGLLNRKIQFYNEVQQDSGRGGKLAPVSVLYWDTHAEVRPLTPSRQLENNQMNLIGVTVFRFRFRTDKSINKTMLLKDVHTGRLYTIQSINEAQDDRQYLEVRGAVKS